MVCLIHSRKQRAANVGQSLVEDDYLDYAKEMMEKAEKKGVKMLIPIDTVVTKEFKNDTPFHVVDAGCQADDDMGMVSDQRPVNFTRKL